MRDRKEIEGWATIDKDGNTANVCVEDGGRGKKLAEELAKARNETVVRCKITYELPDLLNTNH